MSTILQASGLSKHYGSHHVLQDIDLTINKGEIVGLIGPNGAGKTTLLKAILGLAPYDGELDILGLNPKHQRDALMKKVSFIADTATLPQWISIDEVIAFMASVHPQFNPEKARAYLKNTNILGTHKVRQLSKGMVTKAHLSLIMAIDSEILVLDEPTLGLDIVKRKEFYQQLLGDYFDNDKTIIITTHQVEEIEQLLTRALFIDNGRLILDDTMDNISNHYHSVCVGTEQHDAAEAAGPFHRSRGLKGVNYSYRNKQADELTHLGDVHTPSLADLFVAMVTDSDPATA